MPTLVQHSMAWNKVVDFSMKRANEKKEKRERLCSDLLVFLAVLFLLDFQVNPVERKGEKKNNRVLVAL